MTATRCTFAVESPRCLTCECYADCLDFECPPPVTVTPRYDDAPLKVLPPRAHRLDRRRFERSRHA